MRVSMNLSSSIMNASAMIMTTIDLLKDNWNFIWIIYNAQTQQTTLYVVVDHMSMMIFRICNFPDFAKEWDVSDKGQKVYIEGITYESCEEHGGHATVSNFDCVLTTLIKR